MVQYKLRTFDYIVLMFGAACPLVPGLSRTVRGDAPDVESKKRITVSELNREYQVIGILGQPIGTRCAILGVIVEIPEKPGKFLHVDSVNQERVSFLVPIHLIRGAIPKPDGESKRISFQGEIEIGVDPLASELSHTTILRSCIRVVESTPTREKQQQGKQPKHNVRTEGTSKK